MIYRPFKYALVWSFSVFLTASLLGSTTYTPEALLRFRPTDSSRVSTRLFQQIHQADFLTPEMRGSYYLQTSENMYVLLGDALTANMTFEGGQFSMIYSKNEDGHYQTIRTVQSELIPFTANLLMNNRGMPPR